MRVAIVAAPYPLEEFPSPPLGIAYVAAAFEKAGCDVRIFDYIISGYSKEKLAGQLADFQPDAVGAGSVAFTRFWTWRMARLAENGSQKKYGKKHLDLISEFISRPDAPQKTDSANRSSLLRCSACCSTDLV